MGRVGGVELQGVGKMGWDREGVVREGWKGVG